MKNKIPTPDPHRHNVNAAFLVASVLLVAVAFVLGIYWANAQREEVRQPTDQDQVVDQDQDQDEEVVDPETVDTDEELSIDWLPVENQSASVLVEPLMNAVNAVHSAADGYYVDYEYGGDPVSFRLGTVVGGTYDGFTLTSQTIPKGGLGTTYATMHVLVDPSGTSRPVILDRYGHSTASVFTTSARHHSVQRLFAELLGDIGGSMVFDLASTVPEFEQSLEVEDTLGRTYTLRGIWHRVDYPTGIDTSAYATVAVSDGGSLKLVPSGEEGTLQYFQSQFFTTREDGRLAFYDLNVPFWNNGPDEEDDVYLSTQIPAITWSDGTKNTEIYVKGELGGCGIAEITNVVNRAELGELVQTATYLEDGVQKPIYSPVTYAGDHYRATVGAWLEYHREAYGFTDDQGVDNPDVLAAFAALELPSLFFYQDGYGRWVEFTSQEILPPAECGKPVIYLYPEETVDLEVYVSPQGGFTYTEPVYENGWRVTATPDSQITNRDDGQVYSYLFWEGRGDAYAEPDRYWVVARNDVESFLVDTLGDIGFTSREIADFNAFWLPRMQSASYYQIGFHGTEVMDYLAPLSLSERPDSILRVLMDFKELDAPATSKPPVIAPFEREGFVVTEWGGVIR